CLTCRSCETSCPSGVQYGRLLDIARGFSVQMVTPPLRRRIISSLIRAIVPRRWLFAILLYIGQSIRFLLPSFLKKHVPRRKPGRYEVRQCEQAKVLLLSGCVQSAATPNVTASLMQLLLHQGIDAEVINEGCCGALDYHLGAHDVGKARIRQVIDLLYERIGQIDQIISSATGCGVTILEYPQILADEPDYRDKAEAVAAKVVDVVSLLEGMPFRCRGKQVSVHTPCSMQHGMKLVGRVESILTAAGATIVPHRNGHLCCGSAGTYSILQPEISNKLLARKVHDLESGQPDVIVTANVGCQLFLGEGANVPVVHWVEYLADNLVQD
ncbi:MAG: glycolate oxidase subunit GlcF, partial [Gammaproteobacteria bacterium]|nr:glycolate oxidase subunit GlcF [Gammaproteobacteria bacterium]